MTHLEIEQEKHERTTRVWQKWGFCTKFEHWNTIEHCAKFEHLCLEFPHFGSPKTLVLPAIKTNSIIDEHSWKVKT